jgi:hypothetical protein
MQHFVTFCHIMQYCATSCNIMQHYAILCNILSHCATLCHIMQHCAIFVDNECVRKNVLQQMKDDKICEDLQSYFCVLYQQPASLVVYGPYGQTSIIESNEGLNMMNKKIILQ